MEFPKNCVQTTALNTQRRASNALPKNGTLNILRLVHTSHNPTDSSKEQFKPWKRLWWKHTTVKKIHTSHYWSLTLPPGMTVSPQQCVSSVINLELPCHLSIPLPPLIPWRKMNRKLKKDTINMLEIYLNFNLELLFVCVFQEIRNGINLGKLSRNARNHVPISCSPTRGTK